MHRDPLALILPHGGVPVGNAGVHESILHTIGWTPLVKLTRVAEGLQARLLVKVESANPGGSVKDRVAHAMIAEAEHQGWLRPGGTIIEATAGNTGVGLAMVAAVKGYRCIFVLPDKMSAEKILLLKAYGAEVVITPTNVPPRFVENPMPHCEQTKREQRQIGIGDVRPPRSEIRGDEQRPARRQQGGVAALPRSRFESREETGSRRQRRCGGRPPSVQRPQLSDNGPRACGQCRHDEQRPRRPSPHHEQCDAPEGVLEKDGEPERHLGDGQGRGPGAAVSRQSSGHRPPSRSSPEPRSARQGGGLDGGQTADG